MQRLRDTFRRKGNTLEAQAKAEASKQHHNRQQYGSGGSNSNSRTPTGTPTHGPQSHSSNHSLAVDCYWSGEQPSPPMSPARNETSLSFSSNQSQEDIDEEDEGEDEFDSTLHLSETIYKHYGYCAHGTINSPQYEETRQKSCLEVPGVFGFDGEGVGKQIRSASFDETNSRELLRARNTNNKDSCSNLNIPDANFRNARSRSFDYAAVKCQTNNFGSPNKPAMSRGAPTRTDSTASGSSLLDVPKWKMLIRRSSASSHVSPASSTDSVMKDCIHCVMLSEYQRCNNADNYGTNLTPPASDSVESECSSYNDDDDDYNNTIVGSPASALDINRIKPDSEKAVDEFEIDEFIEPIEGLPIVTLCPPEVDEIRIEEVDDNGSGITVISLEVPVLFSSKQSRSASVDSPYLLQVPQRTDIEVREGPPKARSKSVDIVLPTNPGGPYLIVPPLRQQPATTK